MADIDAALAAAKASCKRVLLVMGTNTCHYSAWCANRIATDRFAAVRDRYVLIYADIGMPHVDFVRHPEVPKRFRFKIKGTPTIAINPNTDTKPLGRASTLFTAKGTYTPPSGTPFTMDIAATWTASNTSGTGPSPTLDPDFDGNLSTTCQVTGPPVGLVTLTPPVPTSHQPRVGQYVVVT